MVHLKSKPLQSVSAIWSYATEFEKENYEMFGITTDSLYGEERYLFAPNLKGYPMLKSFTEFSIDEEYKETFIEKDETKLTKFCLDEEDIIFQYNIEDKRIKNFSYDIGFHHVGFEKDAQGKSLESFSSRVGYLNNRTSLVWTTAWCHLVESHYNLKIPEKAQAIRMIFNELSRIKDHLYSLVTLCRSLGYFDYITNLSLWYEQITAQLRELLLFRNPQYANIVGGVKFDLPGGWATSCLESMNRLEKDLQNEYKLLTKSTFLFERLQVGKISKQEAFESGLTGPLLRSTGYNLDLRKSAPVYFYKDVAFDVPLGINGNIYDRFLVLNEEILQSIKILFQVLDNIPTGDLSLKKNEVLNMYKSDSGTLNNVWESPRGVIFFNAHLEKKLISRLKISTSSTQALKCFSKKAENLYFDDIDLLWSSFMVKMSEVEK